MNDTDSRRSPDESTDAAEVSVLLGDRSYRIHIGPGMLERRDLLARYIRGNQVAIVSNETVAPLYLERLRGALDTRCQVDVHLLPDGEQYKSLDSYSRLMDFLLLNRHNRSTTLIALGGGVVGDLTGFVAATFQRGVDFIQIPTTLLAQVDSSVGGKTAVNHPRGKNMIGAFHQPRAVLADTAVFATLPEREYRAGLAEVLKYGVIRDDGFFEWLEANAARCRDKDPEALVATVRRCCEIKAEVVGADERESGLRAILNFGHTFGHALETLTGYQTFLHGEAIAIGMVMAADLSWRQGLLGAAQARRIRALVAALGLPVEPPGLPAEALREAMGMDKKVVNGTLRLVLAERIGQAIVTDDIDPRLLEQTLRAGSQLCSG